MSGTEHPAVEPPRLSMQDFDLVVVGWVVGDLSTARVFADTLAETQDDAREAFKARHMAEIMQAQNLDRFQLIAAIGMTPKAPLP